MKSTKQATSDDLRADTLTRGTRYPTVGFWTSGSGTSNEGFPPHPYETFSYDAALLDAGIEDFNITYYSSVLPPELEEVDRAAVSSQFTHGAVLECIFAQVGITYSAGPGKGNISIRRHGRKYTYDSTGPVMGAASCVMRCTNVIKDNQNIGGYVCEYVGIFSQPVTQDEAQQQAQNQLTQSMDHLLTIRGIPTSSGTRTVAVASIVNVTSEVRFGYTLNGFGFVNFESTPLIAPPTEASAIHIPN